MNSFNVETAKFALLILPVRLTENTEANIHVHEIKQRKSASSSGIIIYIRLKRVIHGNSSEPKSRRRSFDSSSVQDFRESVTL